MLNPVMSTDVGWLCGKGRAAAGIAPPTAGLNRSEAGGLRHICCGCAEINTVSTLHSAPGSDALHQLCPIDFHYGHNNFTRMLLF